MNWLNYFETVVKANSNNTFIASIILPVKNQELADSLVNASNIVQKNLDEIEINLNSSFGNFKWLFKKEKQWLRF